MSVFARDSLASPLFALERKMVLCLIFKTIQSLCELNVRNPVELKFRDGTGKARTALLSENNYGKY